jgi:hypothetical protein
MTTLSTKPEIMAALVIYTFRVLVQSGIVKRCIIKINDIAKLAIGIMKILRPIFRAMKKKSDGGVKITLEEFENEILPQALTEVSTILYQFLGGIKDATSTSTSTKPNV